MRYLLSNLVLASALVLAGCGGGGSNASSSVRIRCLGGESFCIISCDLGCSQTGCSVTEIAENQRLRFKFSDVVDPASVNGSSISIRTASGVAPDGDFQVNQNEVVFVPRVATAGGVSSFGFKRNESYVISLAGGGSIAQSVTNLAGDGLSHEFSCTVVASLGIIDEDQAAPTVELISPTVTSGAPVNPTVVLRFSELIDTTPLQVSLSEASPIRVALRGTLPTGECNSQAVGIALGGVPAISTEMVGQREVTVVTWQPAVQLPGSSCITVRVTADLRDLSGRSAIPARFEFTTEAGVSTPIDIIETFSSSANQETEISGGVWGGTQGPGARPGLIGGDGRHGSFDPAYGTPQGGGVFLWDTTNIVIPASASLTGQQYEVTDGRFYFTDMVVPENTTIRFVGPNVPVIRVRGRCEIAGKLDVSGVDLPFAVQTGTPGTGRRVSTFNAISATAGQPGTSGGCGAGGGGNGGRPSLNTGPVIVSGVNLTNGQPGGDVSVRAGHAYAGNAVGTGGQGSLMSPASGIWASPAPLVPATTPIYCGYFSSGGGGGGFRGVGGDPLPPVHANAATTLTTEPAVSGGSAFDLMPFPPANPPSGYSSLDHFLVAGSGGGGGGTHGYGLIAIGAPTKHFMAGHGGTGGGGALALRVGGDLVVTNTAELIARGGDGVLIQGDDPNGAGITDVFGISSPGGAGSGGSFVLQSGRSLAFSGAIDARGGEGCEVGQILSLLKSMTGGGGSGADGGFRLEAEGALAFGGTSTPAYVPGEMSGPLTDRDDLSGDTSLWYSTNLIFPPTWLRYELDVDLDGDGTIDETYTDSGDPGTVKAYEPNGPITLPVKIEFQGASMDPTTGLPVEGTVAEWRPGIGSGSGAGIGLDPVTGFRFTITYNRALFPNMVVRQLRVFAQT